MSRKICTRLFALFAALGLGMACSHQPPAINHASLLRQIGTTAQRRDLARLESLRRYVLTSDSRVKRVYSVALYYVAPAKYESNFVRDFPTSTDDVMPGLYGVLTRLSAIPARFPFEALGTLAARGNERAIRKLMLSLAAADGIVAETLGDGLSEATVRHPAQVLSTLASIPAAQREKLLRDPYPWCDNVSALKKSVGRSKINSVLVARIATAAAHCGP